MGRLGRATVAGVAAAGEHAAARRPPPELVEAPLHVDDAVADAVLSMRLLHSYAAVQHEPPKVAAMGE